MEKLNLAVEALQPLAYHRRMVAYLKAHEADVWRWACSQQARAEHLAQTRASLLRDTYRLDADAHPDAHAALAQAMQRLNIGAPATLYQAGATDMNAALIYMPDEVHIVLQGPVLERLGADELVALIGHELAHHRLWSLDEGDCLVADRILHDAVAHAGGAPSHRESLRRLALYTEVFADRGAVVAAGAIAPAVSMLVKVHTGIARVDAQAYLRQAAEVEAGERKATEAGTHPEAFIRARALALWCQQHEELEPWLAQRLHGPLGLERLDLLDQLHLQTLVRGFLAHCLQDPSMQGEAVLTQVRSMFPDWRDGEVPTPLSALGAGQVDDSVRQGLNALLLDLALADPDAQDAAVLHAARVASELGSLDALRNNLKRDAGFGRRELNRLDRQLAKGATA